MLEGEKEHVGNAYMEKVAECDSNMSGKVMKLKSRWFALLYLSTSAPSF